MSGSEIESMAESMRDRSIPHWYSPEDQSLELVEGQGSWVTDREGNKYLDFLSQLYCVNAGHGNDAINEAIRQQLGRISYVSSAQRNDIRSALAKRVAEVSPVKDASVFFAVSGSEANEAALQLAREYNDAPKVLSRWRSYHGATYGASSLTGDPETRAHVERYAATTGVTKFLPPLPECFDADTPERLAEQASKHIEFVVRNEGPDSIAAILTEPIAGTSGAYTPPPGYFTRLREICDEYNILLIVDEVITGFGRCGEWFGIQTEEISPDLITFAKGVTSSYIPLGGVIASVEIAGHFQDEGISVGQTFAGNPLACAAGIAAMDEYDNGLIEHVRSTAPMLEESLLSIAEQHDVVSQVNGRGFLWGIEFQNPKTGEPFTHPWVDTADENPVQEVRKIARENGVLFGAGRPDVQVILAPPLCTNDTDIELALSVLEDAIASVFD